MLAKSKLIIGAVLSCILVLVYCYRTKSIRTEAKNKLEPNDYFFQQRAYPSGKVNIASFTETISYLRKHQKSNRASKNNRANVEEWEFMGPTNIGGRVTDIEKTADGELYIGSASGGIYKSLDEGNTWIPIFEQQPSLSIGDIALASSDENIIYVGTGEANAGGGSIAYDGFGVFRSEDGGDTWTHAGLEKSGSIGKVIIHPDNPEIVYVGSMGYLFSNNGDRGLHKTIDGGITWDNILYINDSTGIVDMAIHPDDPDVIFATSWERVRRPDRRTYGGPSSGIYRSEDAGSTWIKLTNGLPRKAGRIGIAISESSPDILYSMVEDSETHFIEGIYKSKDGGDSWNRMNASGVSNVPFMYWFGKIYVDPKNSDVIYLPSLYMSKNTSGSSEEWTTIFSTAHPDQHAVHIDPQNTMRLIIGNDGGVYTSEDGGTNFDKLNGLPITQFYTCEIDYLAPERLFGGTQDNGTLRTLTGIHGDWERIYSGDGFRIIVDPSNNNNVYVESQWGNLRKSIDGGETFSFASRGVNRGDRFNWNTPIAMDSQDPQIMYFGSNRLYKSTDGATFWKSISPDLTANSEQNNIVFGTLTSISVSSLDQKKIWIGTDDGTVQMTSDGGDTWNHISHDLPNRWVTSVTADLESADAAYVTFSGYRFGHVEGHIYHTSDNGTTWNDISGDLPDVPINDLNVNPVSQELYIATDIGTFRSSNFGETWKLLGIGLPNTVITDLDYHPPTSMLLAATYGKGMYRTFVQEQVREEEQVQEEEIEKEEIALIAFPNPFSDGFSIGIQVKENGEYDVSVYNVKGIKVKSVFNGPLAVGNKEIEIDNVDWPGGIYIVKVVSDELEVDNHFKLIKE